jgi:hypothetical protein
MDRDAVLGSYVYWFHTSLVKIRNVNDKKRRRLNG